MSIDAARRPTLHDVARRAGVSASTASRALSGRPHVSRSRREKVLAAATALGYRPNVTARSLRTSRSKTVGFVASSHISTGLIDVFNGLAETLDGADYTLLVTNARRSQDSYERILQRLFDHRVDGLFLANPDVNSEGLRLYRETGIPMLALVSRGPDCEEIPLVNVSAESAFAEAASRFAALGHRRAALMLSASALRTEFAGSLRAALEESGIHCDVLDVEDPDLLTASKRLIERLGTDEAATIAFATSDDSLRLVELWNERGISVPDQLSLCGITDQEILALLRTPVAAFSSDAQEMGRRAAAIMLAWMDGAEPPNVTSFDLTRWIERESVGRAPQS